MRMQAQGGSRRAAAALTFCLCVLFGARAFAAEQSTAVLERMAGAPAVYELSAGKPRHASYVAQGSRYQLPIEIETGANDSATFALVNSVIEVSPNSLMRIVAPENQDIGVVQRVLQQAGSSLFRVHRGTMDRFQVETPFLVSVVKGTVFNVLVRDDGATVSLQEGRLQVNSLDARQTVELAPGDVAFAGRDGALRLLKVEVTEAGAKTRESVATHGDGGTTVADIPTDTSLGAVRDIVPSSGVAGSGVSGVTSAVTTVTSGVTATVSPTVASVVAPVANVVQPVTENLVAPVVSNVVAPAVNTVVSDVAAPVVNTLVAPVVNTVVAPVVDSTVAPVVNTVVAPVVNTVVAPVTNTVVAPVVNTVVAPVVSTVVAPIVAPVVAPVAPVVAPVVAAVTPVVAPVVTPVVAPIVTPVVAPVVAPVAPVLAPVTSLLGLHH